LRSLLKGRRFVVVVAGVVAVLVGATIASASIPDGSGVIHGCYSTDLGPVEEHSSVVSNRPARGRHRRTLGDVLQVRRMAETLDTNTAHRVHGCRSRPATQPPRTQTRANGECSRRSVDVSREH
jgi:hypothetical protein